MKDFIFPHIRSISYNEYLILEESEFEAKGWKLGQEVGRLAKTRIRDKESMGQVRKTIYLFDLLYYTIHES